jgi:integrase
MENLTDTASREPWNKGRVIGQKAPLKVQDIWGIRSRLELDENHRDLALFNLALDSKLRGCDLMKLKLADIAPNGEIGKRARVMQNKTGQPVQFEITPSTKESLDAWVEEKHISHYGYLFESRIHPGKHMTTRQYANIVKHWVSLVGLDPTAYGTHTLRRTKPTLLYRKTKNLRAVQLLLGHTKLESTVKYLGIEVDDALEMSEHIEI